MPQPIQMTKPPAALVRNPVTGQVTGPDGRIYHQGPATDWTAACPLCGEQRNQFWFTLAGWDAFRHALCNDHVTEGEMTLLDLMEADPCKPSCR